VSVHVTSLPPAAPGSLSVSRAAYPEMAVRLHWVDSTSVDYAKPSSWGDRSNEIGFRIERAEVVDGVVGSFTEIGTALANATSFTDTTAAYEQAYAYRVVAWNEAASTASAGVAVKGGSLVSVSVAPSTTRSTAGASVRLVVTLTGPTGMAVPTGGVSVRVTNPAGADVVLSGTAVRSGTVGTVTFTTSAMLAGTNTIVASFLGGGQYPGSSSDPVTVETVRVGTTITVGSGSQAPFGRAATVMATVSGGVGGSVTLHVDGVAVNTVNLVNGRAFLSTGLMVPGRHAITAVYSGSAISAPSTSAVRYITAARGASRTTLTVSGAPAAVGGPVVLRAVVSPTVLAGGAVTGSVVFRGDNGAWQQTVAVGAGGVATTTVSFATAGTHQVTAQYAGSSNHLASTSSTISVTIR